MKIDGSECHAFLRTDVEALVKVADLQVKHSRKYLVYKTKCAN